MRVVLIIVNEIDVRYIQKVFVLSPMYYVEDYIILLKFTMLK